MRLAAANEWRVWVHYLRALRDRCLRCGRHCPPRMLHRLLGEGRGLRAGREACMHPQGPVPPLLPPPPAAGPPLISHALPPRTPAAVTWIFACATVVAVFVAYGAWVVGA